MPKRPNRIALAAAFCAALVAAPSPGSAPPPAAAPPPASAMASSIASRWLAAHNAERGRIGVPPLIWNEVLAQQSRDWARSLARRQVFEHSRNTRGVGENLWTGTADAYTPEQMIGGFVAEARNFKPGRFPNVSRTGNWADVAHYTQLVWADTRYVGCAVARDDAGEDDYLVCRYWPAGNVLGQRVP